MGELVALIDPQCDWEEDPAVGWPDMDPVYVGPDGFRKWVEDLRDLWEHIESTVTGVEDFGDVAVVDTVVRARARQDLETDWHVYNVIWFKDGCAIRRRVFTDHADAVATAKTVKVVPRVQG
jgi:ketosteroid isomerase-like protein